MIFFCKKSAFGWLCITVMAFKVSTTSFIFTKESNVAKRFNYIFKTKVMLRSTVQCTL